MARAVETPQSAKAFAFDQAPVGPACARHIHSGGAHVHQATRGAARQTSAGLLDHHWHLQLQDQGFQRRADAPPVTVALGLTGFLQGVQMNDQGVRADHLDRAPRLIDAKATRQLRRADVGQDKGVRRPVAHGHVQTAGRRVLNSRALRADGQGDAQMLGCFGQARIDAFGP